MLHYGSLPVALLCGTGGTWGRVVVVGPEVGVGEEKGAQCTAG